MCHQAVAWNSHVTYVYVMGQRRLSACCSYGTSTSVASQPFEHTCTSLKEQVCSKLPKYKATSMLAARFRSVFYNRITR